MSATADEHIRARVADSGRMCELAMAYKLVAQAKGHDHIAVQLEKAAQSCSREAFKAVHGG